MSAQKSIVSVMCPMCSQQSVNLKKHLEVECSRLDMITKKTCSSYHYADGVIICLNCYSKFDSQGWNKHSKTKSRSCKSKISQISEASHSDIFGSFQLAKSKSSKILEHKNQSISTPGKSQLLSFTSIEGDQLPQLFINHLKYSISVYLVEWLRDHRQIKVSLIFQVFSKYCQTISTQLKSVFKKPTYQRLYQIEKLKWEQLLDHPEQIFDKKALISKLSNRSTKQQNKIFKAINKMYEDYPNLFESFKLHAKQQPSFHRQTRPLLPKQFIEMIYELFKSKKRDLVHIALDFMIMYQSGQRFPSDLQQIQENLCHFMQKATNLYYFQMKSAKTKKIVDIILSTQLISLLKLFKWQGFYRNRRFYERIYEILGFGIYSFRRGFFSYLFLETLGTSQAIKLLSGHRNQRNAQRYYKNTARAVHAQLKRKLKIPNLIVEPQTKENIFSKLPQPPQFTQKIIPSSQWIFKLLKHLKASSFDQSEVNYLVDEDSFIQSPSNPTNPIFKDDERVTENHHPNDVLTEVLINTTTYFMRDGYFNLKQVYNIITTGYCQQCRQQILKEGFVCQTCQSQYHFECTGTFCSCMIINHNKNIALEFQQNKKSSLEIQMPSQYLSNKHQIMNQIRFLLHLRGFHFTNMLVPHHSVQLFPIQTLENQQYQEINLRYYEEYCKYEYFPPLSLKPTSISNINGTGFGLFASSPIEKHVFIGEYAADLFCDRFSIEVKRIDTIMNLHKGRYSSQSLSIGPINYCGYVCLINGKANGNCQSLTCIIDNHLTIIIYTKRKINIGQELTYNYYMNQFNDGLEEEDVPERSLSQAQNAKSHHSVKLYSTLQVGIKNHRQNCYINCILQLLRKFNHYFLVSDEEKEKEFKLWLHLKEWFFCETIYDPSRFIEDLEVIAQEKSLGFTIGVQDDAHSFLTYLLGYLDESRLFDLNFLKGEIQQEVTCSDCKNITSLNEPFYFYSVEIKEEIQAFFVEKIAEIDDFKCTLCNSETKAKIVRSIISFPQVLIIYLKRFNGAKKDSTSKYAPIYVQVNENLKFKRKFVVQHIGRTIISGHYRAFDLDTQIQFDDQNTVKRSSFKGTEVVMIVYEKVN